MIRINLFCITVMKEKTENHKLLSSLDKPAKMLQTTFKF